jgi:hypothetical protein
MARGCTSVYMLMEARVAGQVLPADKEQPPYPFKSGDNLPNLTRVHNV